MYTCVCVCVYTYTSMYKCVHIYIRMYVYIYIHVSIYIYTYIGRQNCTGHREGEEARRGGRHPAGRRRSRVKRLK